MSHGQDSNANNEWFTKSKWIDTAALFGLLMICGMALSASHADYDLWGHVQYGLDTVTSGLPQTTTYSYAATGFRWINHENLAEILLAVGNQCLGPSGLLAAKLILGIGIISVIMRRAYRQQVSLLTLCIVCLVTSLSLLNYWGVRPQLLSYLYYTLMLMLLSWCFEGWEGRWQLNRRSESDTNEPSNPLNYSSRRMRALWLMPVLFCFWANSHGGFVAGLAIYIAYLGLRSIEVVWCRGWEAVGLLKRFGIMAVAAVLATLINPYAFQLHLWLISALGAPRPEISEWHAPPLAGFSYLHIWLILGTTLIALALSRRSRDFTHMALLAIIAWQLITHQRHTPFFAIAFGFWIPLHIESAFRRFSGSKEQITSNSRSEIACRWAFASALCVMVIISVEKISRQLDGMPVYRKDFPVSAFEYIADQNLTGKMVVTYDWAQYAIAAFGTRDFEKQPGIQVGFDGRFRTCYPQKVLDMHFDLILGENPRRGRYRSEDSPVGKVARVLDYGTPDLALISRRELHSVEVMANVGPTWTLLYQDSVSQLWGRSSKFDNPVSPSYISIEQRQISDAEQIGSLFWPALPKKKFTFQTSLSKRFAGNL